jgi:hypothetical protein
MKTQIQQRAASRSLKHRTVKPEPMNLTPSIGGDRQEKLINQLAHALADMQRDFSDLLDVIHPPKALHDRIRPGSVVGLVRCDYTGKLCRADDVFSVNVGGERYTIWLEAIEDFYWDEECVVDDIELFNRMVVVMFLERVYSILRSTGKPVDKMSVSKAHPLGSVAVQIGYDSGVPLKSLSGFGKYVPNHFAQ